jgi:hypothetical protein
MSLFASPIINPKGLVVDSGKNYMYVTCINNTVSIDQINMSNGSINSNWFNSDKNNLPNGGNTGLAIDSNGTYMYFLTNFGNICQIEVSSGQINKLNWATIPVQQGEPINAIGIIIDSTGTYMYVTFSIGSNGNIAQINMSDGSINNANWLQNTNGSLTYVNSLVIDSAGTYMYVVYNFFYGYPSTTPYTGYIAQINMSNGTINNGTWLTLQNSNLFGLAIDNNGYMYVTNIANSTISQINIENPSINVLNWVTEPSESLPTFLTIYNNNLYVSNGGNNGIGNICEFPITNTSSNVNVGTTYKGEPCYTFLTPNGSYSIQFRFAQTKDNTVTNYINIFKQVSGFIIFKNYVKIDVHIPNHKIDELIQQNTILNLKNNTNAKYIAKFYRKVSHALLKTLPKSKRGFCMLEPIEKKTL